MLKRKINKEAFDKLGDEVKKLYKEKEGDYFLDVEGEDEVDALRRAKERESEKAKKEKERADKAEEELEALTGADAKKRGDIETLEKSWKEKTDKEKKELSDKITAKDDFIKRTLLDNVALQMATKISTSPSVILPHIKSRLTVDFTGDAPVTKVVDAAGNVSALSVDDLEKEIVANKDFSAILIGSKASGSGASKDGKAAGSGGATPDANGKTVPLSKMDSKSAVDHVRGVIEARQAK